MNSDKTADQPTALYRLYDADDRLIYVGQSQRMGHRMRQHQLGSWWFSLLARIEVEYHPTRQAAIAAETVAIQEEQPAFNVMSTGRAWADFSHFTAADVALCESWRRNRNNPTWRIPMSLSLYLYQLRAAGVAA